MGFEKLLFSEWMKRFRPDGIGRIIVGASKPIEFTEVVCDFCNDEILPQKEDGTENEVFYTDGYSVCKSCGSGSGKLKRR
jgi:hypothetical protein